MATTFDPTLSSQTQRTLASEIGSGNNAASMLATNRLATSAGEATPTQKFSLALVDLLKKYQQLGTGKFKEAELQAQQQQGQMGYTPLPSDLAGMQLNPSQISAYRTGEQATMQPTISGASQMGKTFGEQISGLGDVLSQARLIGQTMQDEENKKRADLIDLMNKQPGAFKTWFNGLDPKEQKKQADFIGVSPDYVKAIPEEKTAPKTLETDQGIFQWDSNTGQWKATGFKPKKTTTETKPLGVSQFNIKAGILGLLPSQVKDIVNLPNPPQWFADKMKQEIEAPLLPGLLQGYWQKAKDKINQTAQSSTSNINNPFEQ